MNEADIVPVPILDRATARAVVADGIARYIAARHARVAGFVDRNFALAGALRLHRAALGLDLLRAPGRTGGVRAPGWARKVSCSWVSSSWGSCS